MQKDRRQADGFKAEGKGIEKEKAKGKLQEITI